ncbi:MAG: hypothetical protein JOZ27_03470 [Caulobacteraceae bacterium]|nr:hypothetical protein [Caulobacteraceae bacterium]
MSNSILTASQITREALRVLHQKLNFIGSINRQYDDAFAKDGARIGNTLRIRLPNQYVVRTGATLSTQDTVEQSTSLTVSTQKGVDLNFTSVDLTLSLDDFSERIIEPAMAVLSANVEADAMSMYQSVYNLVDNHGSAATFKGALTARKRLTDNLAPNDNRFMNLCTQDQVDLVDTLKGLFHDDHAISQQYKEGMLGRTAGFDFYENTLWPTPAPGAASGYVVNGSGQTGSSLVVMTGTGAMNAGDVFTIAGVYRVHPETKLSTGQLQQFVVTAAYTGGAGTVSISPAITPTGATQNVSNSPAASAVITMAGAPGTASGLSLAYHRDAFTFATADLVMPKGIDFAAREVFDGISMRIVRQYDIVNDKFPCRLDILYGYLATRAQWACRYNNN